MLRRAIWILALGVVLTPTATARAQSLVVDLQWPYNVPLQYWDNWKGAPDAHAGFGYQPLYLKFPIRFYWPGHPGFSPRHYNGPDYAEHWSQYPVYPPYFRYWPPGQRGWPNHPDHVPSNF